MCANGRDQALKCADWIEEEFVKTGRVKHLGFSTHGERPCIILGSEHAHRSSLKPQVIVIVASFLDLLAHADSEQHAAGTVYCL
jgi:hypothetical protein